MKKTIKFVIIFAIILLAFTTPVSGKNIKPKISKHFYSEIMMVTKVKKMKNHNFKIDFVCQNGNIFSIVSDDGDFRKNDIFSFIMYDSKTPKVYDDIIVSYQYAGWISKKESKKWIK